MMNATISKEEFKSNMQALEAAFNQKLPQVRLEYLWDELKGYRNENVVQAVKYLVNNKPYMPINADIILACKFAAEQSWLFKKEEERRQAQDFFKPGKHKSTLGRDCAELVNKFFEGNNTLDEKADMIAAMESKYPGVGFKAEAEKLRAYRK